MQFPDIKKETLICLRCKERVPRTARTQLRCLKCKIIVDNERAAEHIIKRKKQRAEARNKNANDNTK